MSEKHRVTPAVFVAVINDVGEVLLQRRAGTGYMDGRYDLPSGHVEAKELPHDAAVRELEEETRLYVKPDDLELFHIYVNENVPSIPYLGFMYRTSKWHGKYVIAEPNKCDDMGFYSPDNLPNVTPQVGAALGNLGTKHITYSYFGENEATNY